MAAPKNSFLITLLLCGCTFSTHDEDAIIQSRVEGCFVLSNSSLTDRGESVWVSATVAMAKPDSDCPCKLALFSYSAFQKHDQQINKLVSGQFTIMGKVSLELPVVAQKQLLFTQQPLYIDINCGS